MKFIAFLVLFFGFPFAGICAQDKNPILGTWQIVAEGTACFETYTFKSSGIRLYKSASEVGESKYTISSSPSAAGYYKFTDTITKSNGKSDCVNHSSPIGDSLEAFVRFEDKGDSFFFCQTESKEQCVGPINRIRKQSKP
jgi:hypothetical protein